MKKVLSIVFLILGATVHAQDKNGVITPLQSEIDQYLSNKNLINAVASECLNTYWETHLDFFAKYRISKYYGDRNPELAQRSQRLAVIKKVGAPQSIVDELESISCIGLTRKCLKKGFYETKNLVLQKLWDRMDKNVVANGVSGVFLIQNLQMIGWKVLYWNPQPANNAKWDKEDVKNLTQVKVVNWDSGVKNAKGQFVYHSGWGMHASRYNQVVKTGKYYTVKLNDANTLVNFGTAVPESLKQAPLFVGVAHAGYHVFPGVMGEVIEGHSMRRLDSIDNLERGPFNPLLNGGAPRWSSSEKYRSGIIAIPPQ